jgi:hypothetical protein
MAAAEGRTLSDVARRMIEQALAAMRAQAPKSEASHG